MSQQTLASQQTTSMKRSAPAPNSSKSRKRHRDSKEHSFTEILSYEGLQYLRALSFSDFLAIYPTEEFDENGNTMTLVEQHGLMQKFCESALKTGALGSISAVCGKLQVMKCKRSYAATAASPTGRIFADGEPSTGLALQRLWSKVRACLTREFTIDLDMKNAHPTILLNICKQNFAHAGWWQPLNDYVKSRDLFLNELRSANVSEPKVVILKALNSSWPVNRHNKITIPQKCKLYHALDASFKEIQKHLQQTPQYKDLMPSAGLNRLGVFINRVLCQEENKLLQEAIALMGPKRVVAPMFDGLLLRGGLADVEHMVTKLNKSFEGRIEWVHKPHDTTLQVDPNYRGVKSFIADTDVKLVDMLLGHFRHKLARCRDCLWFRGDEGTVVIPPGDRTQSTLLEYLITQELRQCEIYLGSEDQCAQIASLRALCNHLMIYAPINDSFEDDYWRSIPGDSYAQGIELWRSRIVYLRSLSRLIVLGDENDELTLQEGRHQLSAQTSVTLEQYLRSSRCRVFERDTFVPSLDYAGPDFNHFVGLSIRHKDCCDADVADAKPYLRHVREIICCNRDDEYEWLLNFLAAPLQAIEQGQPERVRQLVACFLIGGQGAGKGTLMHALERIYGRCYYKITSKADIYDKFNKRLYRSLFVELDEVIYAGNHEQANIMKALTTEPKGTSQDKFEKKRANQPRWFNICGSTNSEHANKTESDGRRDAYFRCSEEHTGRPTQEWASHCANLKQDKYVRPFAKFLYERKLPPNWCAGVAIPQNDALADQKTLSLTPVELVLKTWLDRGYILDPPSARIYLHPSRLAQAPQQPQDLCNGSEYNRTLKYALPTEVHAIETAWGLCDQGARDEFEQQSTWILDQLPPLQEADKVYLPQYGFGDKISKHHVWEAARREFGRIRDFPTSAQKFWIGVKHCFKKQPSVLIDDSSKKITFAYAHATHPCLIHHVQERFVQVGPNLQGVREWWDRNKYPTYGPPAMLNVQNGQLSAATSR